MKFDSKFNIVLAFSFIGMWLCYQLQPKKVKDEIVINDIHIPRGPCVGAVNALLGKAVDSVQICNCIIPEFYKLVEKDAVLVEKFKQLECFFTLEGPLNDSMIILFAKCVRANILDTNAIFHLSPENVGLFKEKFKQMAKLHKELDLIDKDALGDCIIRHINDSITIAQYFSEDYFDDPKIQKLVTDCAASAGK